MRSTFALNVAALAGLAVAQTGTQSDYPYRIDPDSVSSSTRQFWCDQNTSQCPLICLQQPGVTSSTTDDNECDPDQLTYTCVCEGGVTPNITQYSQTLPFFICQEWGTQCVTGCNGDNTCADKCRADHPCGAQDPFLGNTSISSTMSSTSAPTGSAASNTVPVTGFGGGAAATSAPGGGSSGSTGAATSAFIPGAATSMVVLFGSVFFGFAVFL